MPATAEPGQASTAHMHQLSSMSTAGWGVNCQ